MSRKSAKIGMLLLSTGVFLWLSCGTQENTAQQGTRVPVRTASVEKQELSVPVHISGKLVPAAEIKLSFKIGGLVDKILVEEGQSVTKGQLLAVLKQEEIQAKVEQARSSFRKARRDYHRVENLYQDSVATLEQMQDAQTALDMARSNLEIAEFNLKHSEIRSPSAGKILKRFVEAEELVEPGTPVIYFGAGEQAWLVRVGVTDRDVLWLRLGDSGSVTFDAYPDTRFSATVTQIAQAADPMTGTYEVELRLDPGGKKLVSGFVAAVDIFPSQKKSYFILPIEALVEADGRQGIVYTVEEDTARKVTVQIDRILENRLAVSSDLSGISTVVTEGAPYLWEGAGVSVKKKD